ncbi:N-acetylglucosamine-6-phosphate deacetylase [Anaerocolumna cellulosilytica]|uniref:N-acetylglucosamine-6-phosphate deacetylase n=1 Tax=Anaerocolumna cellulosilytica TaxID=433286 RepID=A0A6S6R5Q0_9FIRM|nr:N-acetylglucosamine-6-phosphate deacetylase [Anaerocolumna cellulosilytica]MBB5194016.1 N-acetylglucosamine-6-phosphate deacetylase [Anaerocolumna cellulosilytica]BCJ94770.1 N-acetylglucosamine-6-phosphate deacetylase [Anaerocolumna cellulosilytica]
MIYSNAEVFLDGKFIKADLEVVDGKFAAIYRNGPDAKQLYTDSNLVVDCTGKKILPGFIELHSHGCMGLDFTTATATEIEKMCCYYASKGITSILATTMTIDYPRYKQAMTTIKHTMDTSKKGSRILGINMEGPFLGADRKGAHDTRYLLPIDEQKYEELNALSGDNIRIIDLDPNLENSMAFIRKHKDRKVLSLAHTSCTYNTALEAIHAGASHVTHLFNAMNGLHHREPGIIGAVSDSNVFAEIICDGIHIHPSVLRLIFKAIPEKLILVSDSMSAAGLTDGIYELGGQKVYVSNNKACLEDGTIAGSTTNLFQSFLNLTSYGIPLEHAVLSATLNPAKAVKAEQEIGSIEIGKRGDFIILKTDTSIEKVYKDGTVIFEC